MDFTKRSASRAHFIALCRQIAESGAASLQARAITGHKKDETFAHYTPKPTAAPRPA